MLGLKLWSINTDFYLPEALKLYEKGAFDYIELYVVPDSKETLSLWRETGIPFRLHAPHSSHGVNLADPEKLNFNLKAFAEVKLFAEALLVPYTIVHLGMDGTIEESIRQLRLTGLRDVLLENKPCKTEFNESSRFRGSSISELSFAMSELQCGCCLDIGHAICAYNTFKKRGDFEGSIIFNDPYQFVAEFNKLQPRCYHLSDNYVWNEVDEHFHFGKGDYDLKKIFEIIDPEVDLAIETEHSAPDNLDDFVEDVAWVKNLR
ncbi:MAG: sugar phosphate isomerase/epimerase family protein [Bdellovibrionota bacterium]|jgi:deoxyribonuclease-4